MKGFFVYPMKTVFRFYGAAVSLSRRRSLRRGTPGHDGFPRALGIMPRHFLRRGIRTHNEIPRALGIMRPHHHTNPVGVTLGKKPGFFGSQAFCLSSETGLRFGHDLATLVMVKSYPSRR